LISGGGVFDQQNRQAIRSDLVDLRQDHAKAVRINKTRIDPALARLGRQLRHIDLARRQKHLLDAAIGKVAIHVSCGKRVVGAQRLDLPDRCVVGTQVPKANIVEQRGILNGIDRRLHGRRRKRTFRGVPVQAEGNRSRLNVTFDIRPLDRNLVRPHINGVNDARQTQLQDKKGHDQDRRLFILPHPNQRQPR